ncbi:MAG: baseplate hub protein [Achromobacter sp.]|uniref:baseplate hub protein n=1 Tax=Achromobacter sp. TaxID=134375 RepID=UPI000F94F445
MARFDRVYRLLVGKDGGQGLEIVPPIRLTFDIAKTAAEEPNDAKITLYNLAAQTRRTLEEPGLRCVLYAGYAEEGGPLLMASGSIVYAYTRYNQPDVVTELTVKDGYIEVRDTAVSIGLGPGARASDIIRDIARQMGLPLLMADDAPDRRWEQGFSFYGAARTALHKVTQGTGLEWSIQNQQLQVVQRLGTTRRQAVVLAVDTGLLGQPERTRAAASEKAKAKAPGQAGGAAAAAAPAAAAKAAKPASGQQQRDGWKVKSLLLPTISPGDLVKLESRSVVAFQRAETVRHTGDSEGGDWQTELALVDPNPPSTKKEQS